MKYCNVVRTNIPYETAFSKCKLIQSEMDLKIGDIFYGCILTSTGNPMITQDEVPSEYNHYFKNGMYVNLFPLEYIDVIESDSGNIDIKGFTVYKDEKVFHPLKGFDNKGNEVADLDKTKETVRCKYYYVNESKTKIKDTWS